jgi:hypothetical protein
MRSCWLNFSTRATSWSTAASAAQIVSVMLTGGVPLKVVSDILGQSSIAITGDIYGHVSPDVARRAIDVREGERLDENAFKALVRAAVTVNLVKKAK